MHYFSGAKTNRNYFEIKGYNRVHPCPYLHTMLLNQVQIETLYLTRKTLKLRSTVFTSEKFLVEEGGSLIYQLTRAGLHSFPRPPTVKWIRSITVHRIIPSSNEAWLPYGHEHVRHNRSTANGTRRAHANG